jgi:16S rRNA (cytosine1407-C5)-methyltransferase
MSDPGADKLIKTLARFADILTEAEIRQIQAIQEDALPTGIRANPLKSNPRTAIQALAERYNWEIKPISFCNNAWLIESAETPPGTTIEHRLGTYYLQDAASMVPVSLLDFNTPHPLILDMAASPGGKTTHLIDCSQDKGFIIANDASRSRIPALRSVMANWGGINQAVTNFPGESFGRWFPETFDIVLLDAPCSMENLRPAPNHPPRETTDTERLRLQDRQIQLLISGLSALKIGGQLVYATCSLAPEEDEAVIDRVLNLYPEAFFIEDVSEKVPFQVPGLIVFGDDLFAPSLAKALRLWPHLTGMSGFFCARLKKVNPLPVTPEVPPSRDFSRTQLESASSAHQLSIIEQINHNYGLALDEIIDNYHLQIFQRHEGVFLIPQVYLERFKTLPFEFIGMQIGQWIGEGFQPSHELISRFGHQFTRGKIQINESQIPQWIAGRDLRNPQVDFSPEGQYLLVVDEAGRNLGVGKLLPKRLRNLLPR